MPTIELTKWEKAIFDQVAEQINETATFLAALTREERLNWLKKHQYPYPISFEREIGGTIYTVNAHFSDTAAENPEQKTMRILTKYSTLKR